MKFSLALISAMFLAQTSNAAVMTFDDVVGDYAEFDDTLGDIANLDVTNRTRDGFGNSAVYEEHIEHWQNSYSNLVDIAFASQDGKVGELQFNPTAGFTTHLTSFDFGNFSNGSSPRDALFRIYDSGWNLIWEHAVDAHTGASVTVNMGIALTGTSYFQWGTDWNMGIDNFTYSVSDITAPAVPLPAGLPLMLLGLGSIAALRGRKRN